MGPAFTRVLLNGAPVASASAGNWAGSIQCQPRRGRHGLPLPSELFSSASVYKSQKASIIEGGLAGTVDMRSAPDFRQARPAFSRHLQRQLPRPRQALGQDRLGPDQQHLGPACGGLGGRVRGVAFGQTFYHANNFDALDMRNYQLKAFQANASDNPNNTGAGSQSTPDTVPSGWP